MKRWWLFLSILSISLMLGGCAGTSLKKTIDPTTLMAFPPPPDTTRIQFLRRFSTSMDIQPPSALDRFLFGGRLLQLEKTIVKPYGITVYKGIVYICDSMLPGLVVVDLKENTFRLFQPFGQGRLRKPINVTHDAAGNIYVTDTRRNQVVMFSKDLKYIGALGDKTLRPVDVAIDGDTLWVTDLADRNVEIWSISRQEMIGEFPPNNSQLPDSIRLFVPYSIALGADGHVYVSDFGQFHIQEFDRSGRYIRSYGSLGRSLGQFARPKGIAVDRDGHLYVVDAAFENIQIFDKQGKLLMFFGGSYEAPGNMYLPAQVALDYDPDDLALFKDYVLPGYRLEYLIFVTNQYGPDKVSIYGKLTPVPMAAEVE